MRKSLQFAGILALSLGFSASVMATPVTPDQALSRAISQSGSTMKKAPAAKAQLALTVNSEVNNSQPAVYVFSAGENNGYIVAPADDMFPAVLGYSDSGSFDADNMPESMKWFLQSYAREMDFVAKSATASPRNIRKALGVEDKNWAPIEPLVTSKWDQGAPYNKFTPRPLGYETATGCVATAMAQVMYYHKWPEVGEGSHTYTWNPYTDVDAEDLSMDFTKCWLKWERMLDDYTGAYKESQADAVAELMYACGVSVDMNFRLMAHGSGAQSAAVANALKTYFKYSEDVEYVYRDFNSSVEWEEIIYNELKEKRPVLYSGHGDEGGHAFVCDGYAGNHMFHINWGWSGSSDGYFYLFSLDPYTLGIGGGSGGFNSQQGAVINIKPRVEGQPAAPAAPYFVCDGDFLFQKTAEAQSVGGETLVYTYFTVDPNRNAWGGGFWNMGTEAITGKMGVIVEDKDGNEEGVVGWSISNLASNRGYRQFPVYLEDFEEGVYKVYPAYSVGADNWDLVKMPHAQGYTNYVIMTVNADGTRTFADAPQDGSDMPELIATAFNYNGDAVKNCVTNATFVITNPTADKDYYGDLYMDVYYEDGEYLGSYMFGDFNVMADIAMPYSVGLNISFDPGKYIIKFSDSYDRELVGEYEINVIGTSTFDPYASTIETPMSSLSPVDYPYTEEAQKMTLGIANATSSAITAPKFGVFMWPLEGGSSLFGRIFTWGSLTMAANTQYSLTATVALTYNTTPEGNVNHLGEPTNLLPPGEYMVRVQNRCGTNSYWISQYFYITIGHSVESIALSTTSLEMMTGDTKQLVATYFPLHATFQNASWVSTNSDAVTVTKDGFLHAVGEGSSYIIATTPNGKFDVCDVNVGAWTSVENITEGGNTIQAVYSISGVKLLDAPSVEAVKALEKGVYVVVTENGSYKLAK